MSTLWTGSALTDPASLRAFIQQAPARAPFRRVLMVDPAHFQVRHVLNPHMAGMVGTVDEERAREEWRAIRATYERLGYEVVVVDGHDEFPDLVFAANQLLPFTDAAGRPSLVLSHMAKEERQGEVAYLARAPFARELAMYPLRTVLPLEGTGDGIWHPGRNLLWGGHGFRTTEAAWEEVADLTQVPIVPLTLVDDRMYHLDVALMTIDETTAFSYRGAFDDESWARLAAGFPRLLEVPAHEAESGFALNGHCPDGKTLLLPSGNPETRRLAESIGLTVIELSTREFQRAGGSIFCLKNMLP
ncbi:MAG TPA: arginine deiminase-related protein [Thermoanaerobaculia bacterium]|nr:arginine deiminase-related protein [Thermoanaerobaculia bacterium]